MNNAEPAGACSITRRTVLLSPALAVLIPVATQKGSTVAGSAWTNQLENLIILAAEETGFSGFFVYDPAPGTGNLIASIAAAAGTDPYGNAYLEGVATYLPGPDGSYSQMVDGALNFSTGAQVIAPPDEPGAVAMYSGLASDTDTPGNIAIFSREASGTGLSQLNLTTVDTILCDLPVPGGYPLSGAPAMYSDTYAADQTALINSLISILQDAGIIRT